MNCLDSSTERVNRVARYPPWTRIVGDARSVSHAEDLLERLATPYAVALRLERAGVPAEVIAQALGIEVESVPSLLAIAQAKLAALDPSPLPPRIE